jgi:hypothetical protein
VEQTAILEADDQVENNPAEHCEKTILPHLSFLPVGRRFIRLGSESCGLAKSDGILVI